MLCINAVITWYGRQNIDTEYYKGKKRLCGKENQSNLRMEMCRDTGNNDNVRSYPHGSDNSTEVSSIRVNGNNEGKNGDSRFSTPKKPANKTVLGKPFLEPRLLCHDGWDR